MYEEGTQPSKKKCPLVRSISRNRILSTGLILDIEDELSQGAMNSDLVVEHK